MTSSLKQLARSPVLCALLPYYGLPTSEGEHKVHIDNNNGPYPSLNGICQDFATSPGQQYLVTFDATTEIAYGTPGLLGVSAGNVMVHFTLPNVYGYFSDGRPHLFTGWSSYSFAFRATASTTRLQFYDEGWQVNGDPTVGNASPLLDNVSVSPVPEPSTILAGALQLLPFGAGVLRTLRRRGVRR